MQFTDVVAYLYQAYLIHRNITTDSRHVTPHTLFFALKGPHFDGNAFAEQALEKGASYAVIDNTQYKKDARYILVDDVLVILQRLANHHRKQLKVPIIGITGSSGKTTTKELIQAVLRGRYNVTATQGNLNNHIGVPLTVLAIDEKTEIGIVEMGANHVQQQDFYHCKLVSASPYVVYQSENGQVTSSQLLGRYHFYNIAAALCVAKYFKVNETDANEAIQNYQPSNNRSQLIKKESNTILLDAYNANLESIKGAVQVLHVIPAAHKVLILGDMAELGQASEEAHRELGRITTQAVYKVVLLCGPRMEVAKEQNSSALYFPQKEALARYLERQVFRDTAFLIKGSRFLQLETLVASIH